MKIEKFEDLEIWKLSIGLAKDIYRISAKESFAKDFSLRNQLRSAVVSTSSNIVEGFEKNNNNEFVRFLRIAKGSAGEIRNQLYIALELNYIEKSEFDYLNNSLLGLVNKIGKFISYLEEKKRYGHFKKY